MPLAGGTVTLVRTGRHSLQVSATDATGGTPPYTYRWQYFWPRLANSTFKVAHGTGMTSRTADLKGLTAASRYQVRLLYTDSASATAASNVLTQRTLPSGYFAGLSAPEGTQNS